MFIGKICVYEKEVKKEAAIICYIFLRRITNVWHNFLFHLYVEKYQEKKSSSNVYISNQNNKFWCVYYVVYQTCSFIFFGFIKNKFNLWSLQWQPFKPNCLISVRLMGSMLVSYCWLNWSSTLNWAFPCLSSGPSRLTNTTRAYFNQHFQSQCWLCLGLLTYKKSKERALYIGLKGQTTKEYNQKELTFDVIYANQKLCLFNNWT